MLWLLSYALPPGVDHALSRSDLTPGRILLQNVRREFITGVLSEEELGNKIFVHELGRSEYAERVANLRAYDAVRFDTCHLNQFQA